VPAATAFSAAFETELPTRIDTIRLGILQASLAEYPPSFIVLHPTDWARIETAKDTLGRYIIGDPGTLKPPSLWGLPIVATQAMTITEFLVGTSMAAQVFDRQQPTVEISTEHNVNFTTNMVTIRAEERLTLAIYRPEAFITGSLGSAT
jgi:HK97 family phage major capsid protein